MCGMLTSTRPAIPYFLSIMREAIILAPAGMILPTQDEGQLFT